MKGVRSRWPCSRRGRMRLKERSDGLLGTESKALMDSKADGAVQPRSSCESFQYLNPTGEQRYISLFEKQRCD